MRTKKIFAYVVGAVAGVIAALALLVYAITYHPGPVEPMAVLGGTNAPVLRPGQKLRILSWNVQYMAGRNHNFFYDGGPDERSSREEITATIADVARVIREENPDIVLLQEIDDGSRRTDYENQTTRLLALLPGDYSQHSSAFYHKAAFVPHPHILGAVGMKLVTLSKYRIGEAVRHQLPLMPNNPITRQFHFKRAILEARLPVANGKDFRGPETRTSKPGLKTPTPWPGKRHAHRRCWSSWTWRVAPGVLEGDFNLLPPGSASPWLPSSERARYNKISDLTPLFARYRVVPDAS